MKTIVIANQKGGVGKTTFVRHFYFASVERGLRTLVVDFDPQANTSKTLFHIQSEYTDKLPRYWLKSSQLFSKKDHPAPLKVDKLSGLISADYKLVDSSAFTNQKLVQAKQSLSQYKDDYDICIIDTPPSKGQLLYASLICADYVLSPCTLDEDATDGLQELFIDIERVRQQGLNTDIKNLGIQINRMEKSREYDRATLQLLKNECQGMILENIIYERAAIKLAIRKPVWRGTRGMNKGLAAKEMKTACDAVLNKIGLLETRNGR